MKLITRILAVTAMAIEMAFNKLFVRVVMRNHGVHGKGEIIRRDGTRTPFTLLGDIDNGLLARIMREAQIRLAGPLAGGPFSRMLGAVTHPTAVRTAIADLVVDRVDLNTPPGKLVFQTSGGTAVATLTFSNPAFGNASAGVATASAITSDTNAAGGTIAKAELRDAAANAVVLCAVGTSGSDINMSSLAVGASDTVSMSSLTYTAPN